MAAPLLPNCSVPVCDGPLQDIYCSGPLLSVAWQFDLYGRCPGRRLRFDSAIVLSNFNKYQQPFVHFCRLKFPLKKVTFEQFCLENFEDITYVKNANLTDFVEVPKGFADITEKSMRYSQVNFNKL